MSGLSDEDLFDRVGDLMHEIPELARSIRQFEMQKRPALTSGAFSFSSDWVTVSTAAEGLLAKMKAANDFYVPLSD